MILRDYLSRRGESQASFARRIGVSRQIVSDWIAKRRFPGWRNVNRIRVATEGFVGATAWNRWNEEAIIKAGQRARV